METNNTKPTLSIVIPAYNKAVNLTLLLTKIEKTLTQIPNQIVFVDDSLDETSQLLATYAQQDDRIIFEHRTQQN